jgi:hypothetical protein
MTSFAVGRGISGSGCSAPAERPTTTVGFCSAMTDVLIASGSEVIGGGGPGGD